MGKNCFACRAVKYFLPETCYILHVDRKGNKNIEYWTRNIEWRSIHKIINKWICGFTAWNGGKVKHSTSSLCGKKILNIEQGILNEEILRKIKNRRICWFTGLLKKYSVLLITQIDPFCKKPGKEKICQESGYHQYIY